MLLLLFCLSLSSGWVFASSELARDNALLMGKDGKPLRIVTLTPHAASLVESAGLGSSLVGISESSQLTTNRDIPIVSGYNSINIEQIVMLEPTLIVALKGMIGLGNLKIFKSLGIDIYYSNPISLAQISKEVLALGDYSNDPRIAKKNVAQFTRSLSDLKQRYQTDNKVSYFYQLSDSPMVSLAKNSWPMDIFKVCGGINIINQAPVKYPMVDIETVIQAQPQAIFISHSISTQPEYWQRWRDILQASEQHHVWKLQSKWLNIPSLYSLDAVEEVCNYFYNIRLAKQRK